MSCSPSSSSAPSSISLWASLPSDILELFVRSLQSSFDRLCFGAVCRSWRDVSATVRQNPRGAGGCGVAALPIMTYIEPAVVDVEVKGGPLSGAAATSATRCFYSLSEDKVYRRQVPPQPRWSRFFGSSRGWLGMVDLGLNTFLFDPVSGARVDLPSLTTLTRLFPKKRKSVDRATAYNIIDEEPADDIFRRRCPRTAINARDKYINRLALSSSPLDDPNCIVMTTVSGYHLLAYTRPGDVSWAEVPDLRSDSLHFGDIIYHDDDRRFYASSFFGETIAIDFEISKSPPPPAAVAQPRSDFVRPVVETIVPRAIVGFRICAAELYLVALPSGEIARVTRYAGRNPYCRTKAFKIHKLKYLGGGGGGGGGDDQVRGGRWVDVVNYVGGCCVFVGLNESMALPALEVLGEFRTNCVFFNDGCGESYIREYSHGCTPDFGIFDLEKDTADILRRIDARPRPMWIRL